MFYYFNPDGKKQCYTFFFGFKTDTIEIALSFNFKNGRDVFESCFNLKSFLLIPPVQTTVASL